MTVLFVKNNLINHELFASGTLTATVTSGVVLVMLAGVTVIVAELSSAVSMFR